jgi:hypothetical protein
MSIIDVEQQAGDFPWVPTRYMVLKTETAIENIIQSSS